MSEDNREMNFLQLLAAGGFYVKMGNRYRPITDKRDSKGNLIDLGYNLYYKNHDGRYELSIPGERGDVKLPAGADAKQPVSIPDDKPAGRILLDESAEIINSVDKTVRGCCLLSAQAWALYIIVAILIWWLTGGGGWALIFPLIACVWFLFGRK